MALKRLIILTLVIAAMSLSMWSILSAKKSHLAYVKLDDSKPDAVAENVTAVVMNKQGTPAIKITAPTMTHYRVNDATVILHPEVTVYRDSPNPWMIQAEYAKSLYGIEQITFWNNVKLQHSADKDNPDTEMQTTALTIYPDKQIASTDQPIVITQPDTTVHATGMMANMNLGTVKLFSQAQGEYAPTT